MFAVGFGCKKRHDEIRELSLKDHNTAIILASVHFEWMIKRAILKLGESSTKKLRLELEGIYKIDDKKNSYKDVWNREVGKRFKHKKLGTVLGNLHDIKNHALKVRGKIIHGNGTVSRSDGLKAVDEFLRAGEKLRIFAQTQGEDLDEILKRRIKSRIVI